MEIQFEVAGCLLMALALLHVGFPKRFNWDQELRSLSLMNRQMMQVHTFFIALAVFLMGLLCLSAPRELVQTELGRTISLGMGLFWAARLFVQLWVFSPQLWKGKRFETAVHAGFSLLWAYLAGLFLWNAWA